MSMVEHEIIHSADLNDKEVVSRHNMICLLILNRIKWTFTAIQLSFILVTVWERLGSLVSNS